jgi:proteasome lid subunit RPN8/RPN11
MIAAPERELEVWQPEGCPIRIEYARGVMEELRMRAVDGFSRLSHGGVEIGGVLFGRSEAGAVRVLAHRPLECEYAFGPSFTLSENDRRALEELLKSAERDPELAGMQAVGWYHSHTRKEIQLTEKDIELFECYFPQAGQIALVLRPHMFDPTRAGFFFRETDGSIHAQSSYREFVITPPANTAAPGPLVRAEAPARRPQPPVVQIERTPVRAALATQDRSPRAWMAGAALGGALLAAAAVFWMWHASAAGLSLRAFDVGGQLRIDWDRNAPIILRAQSGALEIDDGPVKLHNELDRTQLRGGSLTYVRTSGEVVVRLLVRLPDQATATETTQFLGPPAEKPVKPVEQPPEANSADRVLPEEAVDSARAELERQAKVADQLQQRLNRMAREARRETANPPASRPAFRPVLRSPEGNARAGEPLPPAPAIAPSNSISLMATAVPNLPELRKLPLDSRWAKTPYQGPSSGSIIWTGRLPRNGTVQILGSRAWPGHITGALPGVPVRVRALAAELKPDGLHVFTSDPKAESAAPEAPGAQNGWNRTVYNWNPRQAGAIRLVETPGPQNDWGRLVLRAEQGEHSVVILRWELMPPEAAAR